MTKKEKEKLHKAIDLLLDDPRHFNEGISILFELIGVEDRLWKALNDPNMKTIPVRLLPHGDRKFRVKIKED